MATFTMEEFMAKHQLVGSLQDPTVTRLIAKKLRSMGYTQIRVTREGVRVKLWTNERGKQMDELKSKLAAITEEA